MLASFTFSSAAPACLRKFVEDIKLQLQGDLRRFQEAKTLALRLVNRSSDSDHFYQEGRGLGKMDMVKKPNGMTYTGPKKIGLGMMITKRISMTGTTSTTRSTIIANGMAKKPRRINGTALREKARTSLLAMTAAALRLQRLPPRPRKASRQREARARALGALYVGLDGTRLHPVW